MFTNAASLHHPFRFYTSADRGVGTYDDNVTTTGDVTTITITDTTPHPIYYQCTRHEYMGHEADIIPAIYVDNDISINVSVVDPFAISSTEPVSYRGDTIIISTSNNTREDVSYNVSFTGALTQSDINGSSLNGTLVGGYTDIELSYNVINNISGEFIFTISGETGTDTDLSHAVTVKEPFVLSSAKNVSYISDTIVITATNNTREDTSYNVILSNGVAESDFAVGTVFSGNLTANKPDIELSYDVINNVSGDFVFAISGDYTDISVNVDVISPFVITEVNAPQFLFKGETLEYTVTNQLPTDVSYEVIVQDSGSTEGAISWSGSNFSGTIVGGNPIDLSFTLSNGAGFFTLVVQNSDVSMSSSTVQAVYVDHNYYVKPCLLYTSPSPRDS